MCQVGENGFLHPERTVGMALLQSQLVIPSGILIVLLLVVDDSQLGVNQGITGVDFLGFLEGQSGRFEVVGSKVLHAHIEVGLCASWE